MCAGKADLEGRLGTLPQTGHASSATMVAPSASWGRPGAPLLSARYHHRAVQVRRDCSSVHGWPGGGRYFPPGAHADPQHHAAALQQRPASGPLGKAPGGPLSCEVATSVPTPSYQHVCVSLLTADLFKCGALLATARSVRQARALGPHPSSSLDPYKTLGVSPGADEKTIKKAYRKLALE